jgi:hypothetical protein
MQNPELETCKTWGFHGENLGKHHLHHPVNTLLLGVAVLNLELSKTSCVKMKIVSPTINIYQNQWVYPTHWAFALLTYVKHLNGWWSFNRPWNWSSICPSPILGVTPPMALWILILLKAGPRIIYDLQLSGEVRISCWWSFFVASPCSDADLSLEQNFGDPRVMAEGWQGAGPHEKQLLDFLRSRRPSRMWIRDSNPQ